ncbi:hypothetical protein L21SP5_02993 [Salinivirga cyanobacteriivorans]|uniref:Uncharacterized protein n=1 Tax=Salinivirga cyanobacteriivorans TaxID=1307839 RepID=A0A0S2I346_9BACT|nr:hypothetical protein L21SP5_02993 [Salinivirga cyanobacteriivorans]
MILPYKKTKKNFIRIIADRYASTYNFENQNILLNLNCIILFFYKKRNAMKRT